MDKIKNGAEEIYLAPETETSEELVLDEPIEEIENEDIPVVVEAEPKKNVRVGEILDLRESNRKVYRMSDGAEQIVLYPETVHVYNDDEQSFEVVDKTIVEEEDGRHYISSKNHFIARFNREEESDELFSVESGMYRVTVSAKKNRRQKNMGAKPHVHKKAKEDVESPDVLVFEGVQEGSDYEYSVTGSGVKENIVIKKNLAVYRYPFDIQCENVTASFDELTKQITFISNETGEEVFYIPAPFMMDANGYVSTAVSYELKCDVNGKATLAVTADSDWINDDQRVLPVVIDPQVKLSGSSAMTTYSWGCGCVYSGSSTHIVGTVGNGDGDCNARRIYMKLNMPSLPRNPRIKKAELVFKQANGTLACKDCAMIGLYRVNNDVCVGDCTPIDDSNLIDFAKMKESNTVNDAVTYTFDVTTMIDEINNGENKNRNLVLKMLDESDACNNTINVFGSTSGSTNAPQLIVTYESSYAVNDSYRSHTHELGRFGQASIDLQCGNLMFESEDFAWAGNRMPVTIKHLYNSALSAYQYTANSGIKLTAANFSAMKLGYGYKLNIMQSLISTAFYHEGKTVFGYVYIGENGSETYFVESEKCACCDDNSQCYNLYEDVNGGDMLYDPVEHTLKQGEETYQFDTAGRLISITDVSGNHMDITYTSNRITSVTDGAGRDFSFAYNSSGFLTSITAPDNTSILYTYLNNLLTSITYPDGKRAVITYSSLKPASVTLFDAKGTMVYKVDYTFAGDRLTSVSEHGSDDSIGAKSIYSYSSASARTIVQTIEQADEDEDENIIKTVYTFDDDGNVVSEYVYSEDTGNTGVEGEESGIHPYSGDGGTGVVSNINNLLKSHNFESLDAWKGVDGNCEGISIKDYTSELSAKFGKKLLRVQSYVAECVANGMYQTTNILPAGKYTFSAYLRVLSSFSGTDAGAYIRVTDVSGNVLGVSERLVKSDSEYTRLVVPFEIVTAKSVRVQILVNGKGTVYADAAQLENNPYANAYNMLENGNFESGIDGWEKSSGVSYSTGTRFNMSKSLYMNGSVNANRYAYQTPAVRINRSTRETFTLSGWAKGYGLPNHERDGVFTSTTFRLRAVVKYNDTYYREYGTEEFTADFSPCTEEWQFASVQFSKSKYRTIQYIRVYCDYGYNFGTVYFDDIQLVRNSLETGLSASDFVVESTGVDDEIDQNTDTDTTPTFNEAKDRFGNALTETTFTDGEFGTIYRAFGFTPDCNCAENAGNDLVSETDARGYKTTYTVDEDTSRNEEVTDRLGNKTAYEYDVSGKTTKVTSKDMCGDELATVSYAYDAFDNMTEIVRGDGMKYVLAYNAYHNLESIGVDGKDDKLVQYTYKTGNGRLKEIAYANGDKMKATYNGVGQMVAEKWYNSSDELTAHYKYVYDGQGNIVQSIDVCGKKCYNYEYEEGNLVRATESDIEFTNEIVTSKSVINTVKYYYDSEGKMTKKVITPASGSAQTIYYENSEDNTVVKFSAGGKTITAHSKTDSFGRKVFDELQLGTDFVSRQFVYHAGKVTDEHKEKAKVKSSATTQLVSQIILSNGTTLSYGYDAEERITSVVESYTVDDTPVTNTTLYTYDALGQLLTETVNGTVVNTMTYDNYGNVRTKNGIEYTYGDENWKDLLTGYGDQTITYDKQGNPTNYLGHTLTWEKGRQLKKFVKADETEIEYTYNANGVRTGKKVDGVLHTYTLDGTKILREIWGNNTLIPLYDNEDGVCGILYNNVPYYFIKNLQGDVIAIVDKEAKTVARYSYDAWGVCTLTQDSVGIATVNPFRYRGYYYDEEIGMYYLQSRCYDATLARFINCDAVDCLINGETANKLNEFSYCENDPVDNDDPNGMWIQYVIGAAIGGILNVAFYVIDCAIAKTKVNVWKALLNFLNGAVNGLIAATGAALIWQIVAGIASGLVSLFIGASRPTLEDLIIAVICGILSGILAGTLPKGANKHINYLMKNFGKKVKASIFKSGFGKNLMKAAKYVFKNSKKLLWKFIKSYCIPNTLIGATPRIKAALGV